MKKTIMHSMMAIAVLTALNACSNNTAHYREDAPVNYQAEGTLALSLPEIASQIQSKQITSVELVQQYLNRIDAMNLQGPKLRAVISVNPNALDEAKALDSMAAKGEFKGPLHGVPILLKDNIEAVGMPTTAGAYALKDNDTGRDSPLVQGLKEQGAIILGKTNLSQWANFRSNDSMSGWSAMGGQVRNPHYLDRNPCGSSSGSGSAAAASFAAGTVGTETNGSIICPSNANGIVGFKPTVGLVSQELIIPISHTQDTAGPMTKTVKGSAMMLNAMATGEGKVDYVAGLKKESLEGVRVGVLRFAKGRYGPIEDIFNKAIKDMEAAGAVLVEIEEEPEMPEGFGKMAYDLLKYEFKAGLNDYLASTKPEQVPVRTLEELIAFNQKHADKELTLFDQSILVASQAMGSLDDEDYKKALEMVPAAQGENGIDAMMKEHNVAVLVSPSGALAGQVDPVNGDVWPSWAGAGGYAARSGYPHATVPTSGFRGMPLGISFIGAKGQDANVLAYAYSYEQATLHRLTPRYLATSEDAPEISTFMEPIAK